MIFNAMRAKDEKLLIQSMSFITETEQAPPLKPPHLQPGDTIGIVSPAGPLNSIRLSRLEKGIRYLFDKGYDVAVGRYVREQQGYLAGSDDMRAADLNYMLRRQDVKAIFTTRGGYGVSRILDKIDYDVARNQPKILMGYSDITALQMALYVKSGLITFSGPMVAIELGRGLESMTEKSMWSMLATNSQNIRFDEIPVDLRQILSPGRAEGRLLGGCLSVLVSLLGTPFFPDMNGAILLLEDVGEDLYKIDRFLSQLKNSGVLDAVSGVLLGQFMDIAADDNINPADFQDILDFYFASLDVPVLYNFPYGHTPLKYTLPLGCRIQLDAGNKEVKLLESCLV
jgi:muramoyltetrapeptide carboxypeptidase